MSSLRFTGFMFLVLLFCLLLNVSFPFAQSVRGTEMEENPQLIKKSVGLKISSRTSLRVNKGLLPQYEVTNDFAENGSKEGGAGAEKKRNLLRDNGEVKNRGETGAESLCGKQRSISEVADEKHAGFMGNTVKAGLDVRHRLRPRSKRKGKGGGGRGYASGFVAFNADYHFPRKHPPRNN